MSLAWKVVPIADELDDLAEAAHLAKVAVGRAFGADGART